MWNSVFSFLRLSCRHRRLTKPFSTDTARQYLGSVDRPEEIPPHCSHYVVCLDCGRRFGYDWAEMRVIKSPLERAG
jgi:DNA-directed RNA polymerase subunit RPC12/RpoP